MNSLHILVNRWQSENVGPFPPYGEATIRATFLSTGIEPPEDLVYLYGVIGGMDTGTNELWRLWPLNEVEKTGTEANEFGVLFSDYFISSWCYRIKPNDAHTSSVYVDYFDGRQPFLVAQTLEQFFDRYKADANDLLAGGH